MKTKYILFALLIIFTYIFSWYFVLCFCSTYINSNRNWLNAIFLSLIWKYFVTKFVSSLIKTILREISKNYPNVITDTLFNNWQRGSCKCKKSKKLTN